MRSKVILSLVIYLTSFNIQSENYWRPHGSQASILSAKSQIAKKPSFNSTNKNQIDVDFSSIKQALLSIDSEIGFIDLDLPLPTGEYVTYRFTESSIMQPKLAEDFPNIKTFKGVDVNNTKQRSI